MCVKLYYVGWFFCKVCLCLMKWIVWVLIGLGIGGVWVFYFVDVLMFFRDLINLEVVFVVYVIIVIFIVIMFVFGGFMCE